jgi:nitric oxide reductase subunit C
LPETSRGWTSYWREILFASMVASYAILSVVAYTDHPNPPGPQLSDLEREGLDVWRRNNCQVCHQIHGFGGFLGPDLTNLVDEKREDIEFAKLLTNGYAKMPALHLPDEDQRAVLAFLRAVNRTGRSQPRPNAAKKPVEPAKHWTALSAEGASEPMTGGAKRGGEIFTTASCGSCHVPFMQGFNRAPDLTLAAQDRSAAYIGPILEEGRRVMPRFVFSVEQVNDLSEYLEWVARNRAELVEKNDAMLQRDGFTWKDLPWWEYK